MGYVGNHQRGPGNRRSGVRGGLLLAVLCVLGVLVVSGCGDLFGPPDEPTSIELVQGANQRGIAGDSLPAEIVVQVRTERGRTAQGVPVRWEITGGGGEVSDSVVTTDNEGRSSVVWTLGAAIGEQRLQAQAAELPPVQVSATSRAGPLAHIVVTPDTVFLTALNDSLTLRISGYDRVGNRVSPGPPVWQSLDTSLVRVEHGLEPGTARAIALAGGSTQVVCLAAGGAVTDTVIARVQQVAVSFAVSGITTLYGAGDTLRLAVAAEDGNGYSIAAPAVSWRSLDPRVARVEDDGLVRAESAGVARLIGSLDDLVDTVQVRVVPPLDRIVLEHESFSINSAWPIPINAQALDEAGDLIPDVTFRWSSSDTTVATVDTGGTVQGRRAGKVTIRAKAGGISGEAEFEVARPTLRLEVAGVHVNQSVQDMAASVPLIAGRAGWARVFLSANQDNGVAPPVRVRAYHGASQVGAWLLSPEAAGVPLEPDEGSWDSSVNLFLPGDLVQPRLVLEVEVDPDGVIGTAQQADSVWHVPEVRRAAPHVFTFVPIYRPTVGYYGRVWEGNAHEFLDATMRMFPLSDFDMEIREPYTTAVVLEEDGTWGQMLGELSAVRIAEVGTSRLYYGVLNRTGSGSTTAGIAYRPGYTALGWDPLPAASRTAAHEWGHNWNRRHAPCGGPAGIDPNYPYPDAHIGVWGLDLIETDFVHAVVPQLISPTTYDLMSYCNPKWVSDYTYVGVMDRRESVFGGGLESSRIHGTAAFHASGAQPSPSPGGTRSPGLLVWGRIHADTIVVEPAFHLEAYPALPERAGPYRLEGFDRDGRSMFAYDFQGKELSDGNLDERHFAFFVPLGEDSHQRLEKIRVSGAGLEGVRRRAEVARPAISAQPALQRLAPGTMQVDWQPQAEPAVMVRNPETGNILSIARGGQVALPDAPERLELILSDGVRSRTLTVSALP